jgi:predicted ATPase
MPLVSIKQNLRPIFAQNIPSMYIKEVHLEHIKSIRSLPIVFDEDNLAGWHVFIGDNGAGKSTVVRAIALALLGFRDALATREDWNNWLSKSANSGKIQLKIRTSKEDERTTSGKTGTPTILNEVILTRQGTTNGSAEKVGILYDPNHVKPSPSSYNWGEGAGWFSAAYGPFRRFSGGNAEKEKIYHSHPKLGAHLSIFGEDIALSEAIPFLRELYIKKLEGKREGEYLDQLVDFVNRAQLLPHGATIQKIDSESVYFNDGNGQIINALNMSDGFRSILSLTFELIRQLVRVYGSERVFKKDNENQLGINLPGVVLIDEIDAHLHPTWQVRIGDWFLKYFPNIQFIVTTHSPLICHAAHKGSVWRLAAPGSNQTTGSVTGTALNRLLYGNILDAFGTDLFGIVSTLSPEAQQMRERLAELNVLAFNGKLTDQHRAEISSIQAQMPSEA